MLGLLDFHDVMAHGIVRHGCVAVPEDLGGRLIGSVLSRRVGQCPCYALLVVGVSSLRGSPLDPYTFVAIPVWKALQETRQYLTRFGEARFQGVSGVDMYSPRECLRTVNYGNYGIFLILGNAGFLSSAVLS